MKMLAACLTTIIAVLFAAAVAVGGVAGMAGAPVTLVAPPNSNAFGMSLDAWMGAYWRQYLTTGAVGEQNAAFLPIVCAPDANCSCSQPPTESPCKYSWTFEETVAPGTPLVLPLVGYLGFSADDFIPNNCWGGTCSVPWNGLTSIFSNTSLDGQPIGVPNAASYVGPTPFEPPIPCVTDKGSVRYHCVLYQAIGVVIKPLAPGEHQTVLHTEFNGDQPLWPVIYDNRWVVRVLPPARN